MQIDIPKHDRYVRTYIGRIDPFSKPHANVFGNDTSKSMVHAMGKVLGLNPAFPYWALSYTFGEKSYMVKIRR